MRFGDRILFDELDWLVAPGDRIGVVGGNGTGKSTLLKIIHGSEHLDRGEIERQKNIQVGYLPQEGLAFSGRTVFEECRSVFDEAISLEAEMEELTRKMGDVDPSTREFQAVMDRYEWCTDRYQALDGYSKEAQVGTVLGGPCLRSQRLGPSLRGVFGRLADARRAGQASALETQRAVARRADQPPRSGGAKLA